ncbi:MAG: rhomboid family intramembrane serine protease [Candidatus Caldarchaeum sp.]
MTTKKLPWATFFFLAINLFSAGLLLGDVQALWRWGFISEPPQRMTFVELALRAFTSLFVHADPLHLLANLLVLAAMGPYVESAAGTLRFIIVYLAGGIGGTVSHGVITSLLPGGRAEPLVGASACIAGLIGYAWLSFYRHRVPILPKIFVPVWLLAGLWALAQLAAGILTMPRDASIAYWAHLGGFITGFLLAVLSKMGAQAQSEAWLERLEEAKTQGPSALIDVAEGFLSKFPDSLPALSARLEGLLQLGETEKAREASLKLIETDPTYKDAYGVRVLIEENWASHIPPSKRLRLADQICHTVPTVAEQLLLSIISEAPTPLTPTALLMLAEITHHRDIRSASLYAQQLIRQFPLTPEAETLRRKLPQLLHQ